MDTECPGCLSPLSRDVVSCGACHHVYHAFCFQAAGCLVRTCRKFGRPARPIAAPRVASRPARVSSVSRATYARPAAPERAAAPIVRILTALALIATGLAIIAANLVPVSFWVICSREAGMRGSAFASLPLMPAALGLVAGMRVALMLPLTGGWRWLLLASWMLQAFVAAGLFHAGMAVVAAAGAILHATAHILHAPRPVPLILRAVGIAKIVECLVIFAGLCAVLGIASFTGITASPVLVCALFAHLVVAARLALVLWFPNPAPGALAAAFGVQVTVSFGLAIWCGSGHQLQATVAGAALGAVLVAARCHDRARWGE